MALSPWPVRSTMPVAWPAAVRQLAASLNQSVPETGSLTDDPTSIRSKSVDVLEVEYTSNIRWWYSCGASSVLSPWYAPRGGIIG